MNWSRFTTPEICIPVCLAAVLFVTNLYFFMGYGIGDGFITARYAENLVDHGEIAFNRGEAINAITSPLHMLFLSLLHALGGDTIVWNKIFAALSLFAGTMYFSWSFRSEPSTFILSLYVNALSPFLVLWTFSGLETAYVFAAVAVFCSLMMQFGHDPKRSTRAFQIGIVASVLFLLRFETILLTAPACIYAIISSKRYIETFVKIAIPASFSLMYLIFSYFYFGDILPTSFYHKTPSYGPITIGLNAFYGLQFLLFSGLIVVLVSTRKAGRAATYGVNLTSREWWIPASLALLVVFWLGAATKHMMYGYRIFLPYLPFLFIVFHALGRRKSQDDRRPADGQSISLASFLLLGGGQLFLCLAVYYYSLNPSLFGEFRNKGAVQQMRPEGLAKVLKMSAALRQHWAHINPEAKVGPRLYTKEAGLLPYYFRESIVLDQGLISHRHHCKDELKESANYVVTWFPAWGALERQLPRPISQMKLVFPDRLPPPGTPYQAVFYNPTPKPYRLPPRVNGDCLED